MQPFHAADLGIFVEQEGSREYLKVSYPVRFGRYSEIRWGDYVYQFNLKGEIRHLQGRKGRPHAVAMGHIEKMRETARKLRQSFLKGFGEAKALYLSSSG